MEAKGWLWDGLEHYCFVRWQSFNFVKLLAQFHCFTVCNPLVPNGTGIGPVADFSAAFLSPETVFLYKIQKFCNPQRQLLALYRVRHWRYIFANQLVFIVGRAKGSLAKFGCSMALCVLPMCLEAWGWFEFVS